MKQTIDFFSIHSRQNQRSTCAATIFVYEVFPRITPILM
uniref:Uncharacterized protein n=1 Tax=Anguilla anguilla TaxID=7936 RepID=A0A0E9VTM5_ANGAN